MELENICQKEGYDTVFMGHRVGHELAECFASADVFAFPSFTEASQKAYIHRGQRSQLRLLAKSYSRL